MHPGLASLIALQAIDAAVDAARRRIAELPAAEGAIAQAIVSSAAAVDAARTKLQANVQARRALDKDVAAVDVRLARFDDHRAAVKTNQEYSALLHEIATAKAEKDAIEDRILLLMEEGDALAAELKSAEAAAVNATRDGEKQQAALATERRDLDAELARLQDERRQHVDAADAGIIAKYEQLRSRRGVAVTAMANETCTACHVRLRPHVAQLVRRNDEVVQCESCQRILYS